MTMRTLVSGVAVAALAAAVQFPAYGQADKANEILAASRKAIGGKKLEGLKTFSAEAKLQRNLANFQIGSDVELMLEMPDKYARAETMSRGPMPMNVSTVMGFNGDTALGRVNAPGVPGGGAMVIRMGAGGAGAPNPTSGEKMTPEQQEEMNRMVVRNARQDVSRLMLGWFAMTHPAVSAEYTYFGEAESPDGKAHVIDVKDANGFAARLFIDQTTQLPLMVTYRGPQMRAMTNVQRGAGAGAQGGRQMTDEERQKLRDEMEKMRNQPPEMVEYTMFFGDWRDVDGIRFPHLMQRAVAGTTDEEWSFSKIKVNPRIDAKKFQPEG